MSEIKYVSPSTLTHYDEKIKDIIDDKVDKIDGKGLSANDLTNELKTEYDDTVAKAHEHSNIDVLKKFSEDSNGMPLYDNDKFYDGLVANDLTTTDEGYALDARQGKVLGDRVSKLETPTFTQATTRANIASGESTKTILGKIKKYFADLKSHAFNAPANNLTTTTTGYALDATQGKALQDKLGSTDISAIGDGTVTNAISTLNSNLEYEPVGSTDVNTLLTPGKYFVMNAINLPQTELDAKHGFLDVIYYNGAIFNPDGQGLYPVIKQIYQSYYTNNCYTRNKS